MSIEYIIITLSYFGIFMLMTSNGIVSFPSSQILYIIAGYFAFKGDLNLFYIIIFGSLGQTIGNFFLYEVSKKKGIKYAVQFVKFVFPFADAQKEIKKFQIVFNKKKIFWLFFGKLTNPTKIFISIPAGIANIPRIIFLPIVYITSAIWAIAFTLIGYYFGKSYNNFGYIGAIILIIAIIIMSYFYKLMNSSEVLKELKKTKN